METIPYHPSRRFDRRSLSTTWALPAVLVITALALSSPLSAQSLVFSDPLTGPTSPALTIPADYSYSDPVTAPGLQRTGNSVYRSLVKTVSGAYLTATQFTADVSVNVAPGDIAYIGLGQGVSNPNYGPNEPTNSFVFRIHNLGGAQQQIDTAVSAGSAQNQFLHIGKIGNYTGGSTTVFRIERDGDNIKLSVPSQNISHTYSLAAYSGAMSLNNTNTHFFFGSGNTGTRFSSASVSVPVYASGISPVIAWNPIFPAGPVIPDSAESKPVPTVGYSDPRWTNPHSASAFAKNSHPWEHQAGVPAAFKFDANWINAWSNLNSNGHGISSPSSGWSGHPYYGYPHQSWTKYSTTVVGSGSYVLQFLADNASWIYIDGALVGFQDYNWSSNGTGRFTIQLNGAGAHELSFVIWDGGGLAGGKFRLETTQSFLANNPGATLPPAPATVTLSNLSHTYDGTQKSATVTTAPAGLTTSVTYNGSSTAPTAVGSYNVVATVTAPDYLGAATGTLTIGKATATITLANLEHTYDGTVKSATATTTPAGLSIVFNYSGGRINAGSYGVQAIVDNPNYTGSKTGSLEIAKANATVTVNGYTGTYDAAAHGATGSASGVGGVDLSAGLNLGSTFTDAPGGTANWTFSGGTNYNDASGTAAIVINKANPTVTVNGYTGTYDGAAHGATGSATGVGGVDLSAGLNLGAQFTNVPGGTANWRFSGGTNYNDASGTAAIVINKATATVVVVPYNVEYDGQPHAATVASISGVNGETGATVGTVTLNTTHTNVGIYSDTWSFTGAANYNNIAATAITDTIKDTTAPTITSLTTNAPTLWQPNHKMVAVTVNAIASDLVGVTSLKIISVTSNEPDNGLGDGDVTGDTQITGDLTVNLRAERSGKGSGRIYTITVEAGDAAGNTTTSTCAVSVPVSQGKR